MYATRALLRGKGGVPAWAQHMAKQPAKAGRLPPTNWGNAPDNGQHPASEEPAASDPEARKWEELRKPIYTPRPETAANGAPIPPDAKMAPPQEGPYGPKRDRSKGFMDSFRSLSPQQRLLVGGTLGIFGIALYMFDSVVKEEKDVEVADDLKARLSKAQEIAAAQTAGPSNADVAGNHLSAAIAAAESGASVKEVARHLSKAGAADEDMIRMVAEAVEKAAAAGVNRTVGGVALAKDKVVEAIVEAVAEVHDEALAAASDAKNKAGQAKDLARAATEDVKAHARATKEDVMAQASAASRNVREQAAHAVDTAEAAAASAAVAVKERAADVAKEAEVKLAEAEAKFDEAVKSGDERVVRGVVPPKTSWFGISLRKE